MLEETKQLLDELQHHLPAEFVVTEDVPFRDPETGKTVSLKGDLFMLFKAGDRFMVHGMAMCDDGTREWLVQFTDEESYYLPDDELPPHERAVPRTE